MLMGRINRPWQDVDYVLGYFGKTRERAKKRYLFKRQTAKKGRSQKPVLLLGCSVTWIFPYRISEAFRDKCCWSWILGGEG
jgi:hypothetical protein